MIDGAVHPELIPDIAAYRLYLLAVARSATPTEQERRHQAAQLGVIGWIGGGWDMYLPSILW